jgi:hypothetical protein
MRRKDGDRHRVREPDPRSSLRDLGSGGPAGGTRGGPLACRRSRVPAIGSAQSARQQGASDIIEHRRRRCHETACPLRHAQVEDHRCRPRQTIKPVADRPHHPRAGAKHRGGPDRGRPRVVAYGGALGILRRLVPAIRCPWMALAMPRVPAPTPWPPSLPAVPGPRFSGPGAPVSRFEPEPCPVRPRPRLSRGHGIPA